jgi:hypothetical protein
MILFNPSGWLSTPEGVAKLINGFPKHINITLGKPSEEVKLPLEIGGRSLPAFGFKEKAI